MVKKILDKSGKKSSFTSLFGYLGPSGFEFCLLIMLGTFWQSLVQIGLNWTHFRPFFRFDMFFSELTSLGANYSTLTVHFLNFCIKICKNQLDFAARGKIGCSCRMFFDDFCNIFINIWFFIKWIRSFQ